jgi:hypothetical protein
MSRTLQKCFHAGSSINPDWVEKDDFAQHYMIRGRVTAQGCGTQGRVTAQGFGTQGGSSGRRHLSQAAVVPRRNLLQLEELGRQGRRLPEW